MSEDKISADKIDESTMLKQIKNKLEEKNIPIETFIAEWERLEDLEDDREQLNDYIKDLQKKLTNDFVSKDKIKELIDKRDNNGYTSLDCIEDIKELLEESH